MNKLIAELQTEFTKVIEWLNINKLTVNLSKTYFMIFHKSRHKETRHNIKLTVNGNYIKEVEEVKFFGVIIDYGLSWQSHICYIRTKIAKSLGVISRAKKFFIKKPY